MVLSSFQPVFFLYFSFHIRDNGGCSNIVAPSMNSDLSRSPTFVHFEDHFFHFLLVPLLTQILVQTSKHCLLQCLKNDGCFSTNVGAYPRPDGTVTCELLNADKYRSSGKFQPIRLSITTASW